MIPNKKKKIFKKCRKKRKKAHQQRSDTFTEVESIQSELLRRVRYKGKKSPKKYRKKLLYIFMQMEKMAPAVIAVKTRNNIGPKMCRTAGFKNQWLRP